MKADEIKKIDFETIGTDFNDQVWAVYPKIGPKFYVTVLIKGNDVEIISKVELSQEVKIKLTIDALMVAA